MKAFQVHARRVAEPLVPLVSVVILGACAREAPPESPPFEVRDSAGIAVVTSHRSLWEGDDGWSVGPEPILQIGQMEGDPAYEFSRVRGAARLSDGTVVVAESTGGEIRFFDATGTHLHTAGGVGEGPGEFSSLFGISVRGDTVLAHDFRQSRVTLLGARGQHLSDLTLERGTSLPLEVFPVHDGFVGVLQGFPEDLPEEYTYSRRPLTYQAYDSRGRLGRIVDELPGQEILLKGSVDGQVVYTTTTTPLVSHSAYQTVVNGRLVAGLTDRFEVRVYGGDGALRRLIRAPWRDGPVTREEWDRILREEMEDAEDAEHRRLVLEVAELKPAPEVRPAYGRFVADGEGYVWLAPYRPPPGPAPWTVVEVDGTVLGQVDLPEGFRPLHIGPAHVLGVVRDDLGVPFVHLYELSR